MSLKLEDVIRTYVQLRDQKSDLEKALNEQLDPIKKQLEKLESYLLRELTEQGYPVLRPKAGPLSSQRGSGLRSRTGKLPSNIFVRTTRTICLNGE